jgi:translation initiation factor eIF-2B subunit delta
MTKLGLEHFKPKQTNNSLVHSVLSDKINDIEQDRTSGASQLARKALGVLKFFVQTNKSQTTTDFKKDFTELGRTLFRARPNMAQVQNLVAQTVHEVNTQKEHDLDAVRKVTESKINELRKQSEDAVKKSAEHAATVIADSGALATCSYSSTIVETLKVAKRQGKSFKVFVAESKSSDGRFCYGQTLAEALESVNVHAQVFADNQIGMYVKRADVVLVGADSLLRDGSIVNGTPTYELAAKAKEYETPFYAVCETTKANALSGLGENVEVKEGFDRVPPQLTTGVITEKGIIGTNEIVWLMKQQAKFLEAFQL